MELRPLTREDRRLYERIYTDPRMWAELGGVLDQDMAAKLERDVASVEADRHWVLVIVAADGTAAGTVSLWDHEWDGETIGEIGWMVLPSTRDAASRASGSPRRSGAQTRRPAGECSTPSRRRPTRPPTRSAASTASSCAVRSTTSAGSGACA